MVSPGVSACGAGCRYKSSNDQSLTQRARLTVSCLVSCLVYWLTLVFALTGAGLTAAADSTGTAIVGEFKRELQTALRAGLEQGLPEAIAACQVSAPEIDQSLSGDGVRVGRTSHRLRNPANVSPDWVTPVLEDYLRSPDDRAPRTVSLQDNRVGYVEPIITQALCLNCHGEEIDRDVAESIRMLYPADRATGFRIGELRGVFWVEYPAGAGTEGDVSR